MSKLKRCFQAKTTSTDYNNVYNDITTSGVLTWLHNWSHFASVSQRTASVLPEDVPRSSPRCSNLPDIFPGPLANFLSSLINRLISSVHRNREKHTPKKTSGPLLLLSECPACALLRCRHLLDTRGGVAADPRSDSHLRSRIICAEGHGRNGRCRL